VRSSSSDGGSGVGIYGKRLAELLRLDDAPAIVTRVLRKAEIGVFEIRCDNPEFGQSGSLPPEDAYVVGLKLRDFPSHQYWEEGRPAPPGSLQAGQVCLYDLKRDPKFLMDQPFHSLHFHLPRAVFDAIADDMNVPRIGELDYLPGAPVDDMIIRNLGTALLGGFSHPEQVSRMFLEHVTVAVAVHVAHTYGGMRVVAPRAKGGLAPWQLRRATELLGAHLDGSVPLKSLADACGLSTRHFTRAFRASTGLAPFQWLALRRVEVAKDLLRQRRGSLREIAFACGFFDQSHFTNVFNRVVGSSPGAWRRNVEERGGLVGRHRRDGELPPVP
jgi:AraC family transcriptional regulator